MMKSLIAVLQEVERAKALHKPFPADRPERAFVVMMEEAGEVAKCIQRGDGDAPLAEELAQVAATALMWLEKLEEKDNHAKEEEKCRTMASS